MEKYIICVDGGTTNTRFVLMKNATEYDRVKMNIGAGSTSENGNNNELKVQFKRYLEMLLSQNGICEADIEAIILSGMICSELGLHNVSHVESPAGSVEIKNNSETVILPDITDIPMTFIPGVKVMSKDICHCDIMRGEETELAGIRKMMGINESFVLMLPGTHNKIIFADEDGKITDFSTAMSGELAKCICDNTILKEALNGGYTQSADTEMLLSGFDTAHEYGVTSALFKVRVLSKFGKFTPEKLYSFLLGVILHEDVLLALKKSDGNKIIIAGSEPFKSALKCIFDNRTSLLSDVVKNEISEKCTSVGALEFFG